MKNVWLIAVVLIGAIGCKSVKNPVTPKTELKNRISVLSHQNKRKFDYFFYEGQRLKMNGDLNKAKNYFVECLKIDSLSGTCYYELANIAIAAKNYKAAQTLLSNSVRLSPTNKWYQILLGDLYQQNNEIPKAVETYQGLVSKFPNNDEYIYILAQLYYKNKQLDKAIDTYNKLEKNIGINEVISIEKEKIYLEMGKEGPALKEINALIQDNPYEPRYYGFLGDYYLYTKDLDKAEQSYRKILELDGDNGLGYFSISNVNLQKKDTTNFFYNFKKGLEDSDLALEAKFQRLLPLLMGKNFKNYDANVIEELFSTLTKIHKNDARGYIYYANYLQNNNNKEKALAQYKKSLNIDKSNPAVWQDMFFLQIDLGKFDDLYTDTKEALIIYPEQPLFNLFYAMGALQKEEYEKAKEKLLEGLKYVGKNKNLEGQFYAYLGDVEYSLKNSSEAFKNYQKALEIDENNVVVLNNYSYYLSVENSNLELAEKMISKCIELEPGNSTYLDTYAWVLFKRGRYFEAKYIIERAIDNGGKNSEVIVEHYGDILYKNHDLEGALIQWNKSVEMGNDSKVLKEKLSYNRMWKNNVIFIIVTLFIFSCRSTEKVVSVVKFKENRLANITDAQLRGKLKDNEITFDKLYLKKVHFTYDDGKTKKSFKGSFVLEKDNQIIVSIYALMGIEIVRAKLNLNEVIILDKHNKVALVTNYSFFKKKYGIELDFYSIQAILSNALFLYPAEKDYYEGLKKYKHDIGKNYYSFKSIKDRKLDRLNRRSRNNIIVHEFDIDPNLFRILKVNINDFNSSQSMTIDYKDFKNYQTIIFPQSVELKAVRGSSLFNVGLKINHLEVNDGGSLHFKIPSSYKSKRL